MVVIGVPLPDLRINTGGVCRKISSIKTCVQGCQGHYIRLNLCPVLKSMAILTFIYKIFRPGKGEQVSPFMWDSSIKIFHQQALKSKRIK